MLNNALLASDDELNEFTRALRAKCQAEGTVLVKLRDASWREVIFDPADEEDQRDEDVFRTEDHDLYWALDGSAHRSQSLDLIEFK